MPQRFATALVLIVTSLFNSWTAFAEETKQRYTATIQTPDGKPANKARVAQLTPGSRVLILNGEILTAKSKCLVRETDTAGTVQLPEELRPFRVVITHLEGYAHFDANPESFPEKVVLLPWAKVEGTLRIGREPGRKITLSLEPQHLFPLVEGLPFPIFNYAVTTDNDGHFAVDRVIPGRVRISLNMWPIVDSDIRVAAAASQTTIDVLPGKTNTIEIGGTGQAVTARIEAPEALREKIDLTFAVVQVNVPHLRLPLLQPAPIPQEIRNNPNEVEAWMRQWERTDEGKKWVALKLAHAARQEQTASAPNYWATADRQGKFRLEDLPAGDYVMNIHFKGDDAPDCSLSHYRFTIPAFDGPRMDEALDLGVLQLK